MNKQALAMLFQLNGYAVTVNVAGVTHDESLKRPPAGGNTMNWVLGHIVWARQGILVALGEKPFWGPEQAALYQRGSDGLKDPGRAAKFETLVADFGKAQKAMESALERISDADFATALAQKEIPKNPAALQFHEAYHAGQLGILRRMLGKPGAIA